VKQQTAAALLGDMNLTNSIFGATEDTPEVSDEELNALTTYQKLGGVPPSLPLRSSSVETGRQLFFAIGCERCHRATLVTGEYPDPELRNQTIHPYTDLLLHDMGPGLADGMREYGALGREWRTTPLWGLHLMSDRAKDSVYLHDGRARTLEEAILWHGGEGARARKRFVQAPKREQDALIEFLRTL
jgi:CxxC motif-containing protein (DUF1111 family)